MQLVMIVFKEDKYKNEEFEEYLEDFGDKVADYRIKNLPRLIKREMKTGDRHLSTLPALILNPVKTLDCIFIIFKHEE